MPKLALDSLEYRLAACREYIQLWQEYFQFFADDLTDRIFTEEDERRFGELISALSAKYFRFTQLAGSDFKGGPEILKLLAETVSLSYLKTLPEANFNKLQVDWHTLFLAMNKCLGKIMTSVPPERLAKAEANLAQMNPLA